MCFLKMKYPFVQRSCVCNSFFYIETYVLSNISKGKCKTALKNFFYLVSKLLQHDIYIYIYIYIYKVTPFNCRCLCVYATLGHNTRELLTMVHFFEGLQNYVEKKVREKNKIILWDFICTIDKMSWDGGNKGKDFTDLVHIMPCQNYR